MPERAGMTEDEMAAALRDSGYLVVKIPPCDMAGTGHGLHTLLTRSALCNGEEPIPHGYQSSYRSTFGMRVNCLCGLSFLAAGEKPTRWDEHKEEHRVVD